MDRYIVEYSTDGISYFPAGEVLSVNNGNRNVYTFRHSIINTTIIYYRLQMRELNGTYNYSPVITIGTDTKSGLKIYPGFITNGLVNIISRHPVERITISGINGIQLLSKEMNGSTGFFNVGLPVFQKGVYIIRVMGKDFQQTGKIFIQ